jgi:outer membrane lipoprotein
VRKLLELLAVVTLMSACATAPPLDVSGIDRDLTTVEALARPEAARGRRVLWGGVIVGSRNLATGTELEVLSYPLTRAGKPDRNRDPLRRFILVSPGYLEPVDYAPGRLISAVGQLRGMREGSVGETPYTYPVLAAEQVHLWPPEAARRTDPSVHFGVGIGVIFGR